MKNPNNNRKAFTASLELDESIKIKIQTAWSKYEAEIRKSIKDIGPRQTLDNYKSYYAFLQRNILKLDAKPIP
jgi:hypothetical protein